MHRFLLALSVPALALAAWVHAADDKPADPKPFVPLDPPAVVDPDAYLRRQMREQWATPERKKWRIEYHPVRGMEDRSEWHVAGTIWGVRLYPEHYKLAEFDKTQAYELDATAVDQNFGVIDFYIYRTSKIVEKPAAAKP